MAKTYLGFPFDEDLFFNAWQEAPDPTKTAILNSGAMVNDSAIAEKIATGSNLYTIPFYNILEGAEGNYDGATDIPVGETTGGSQTGVVFGRTRGFLARDFVADLSANDPMGYIAAKVANYWSKKRQARLIGILGGIFGISGDADWTKHTVNLAVTTGTAYKMEATTLGDAAIDVLGDNAGEFSLALMHSQVAKGLKDLQVLEYWKQTDANGIERPMAIGSANGYTVVIDDGMPVDTTTANYPKYTTYLLGSGCIRYAQGRLAHPVGVDRDEKTNGGQETLYTRIRETIHPNGFSYGVPTSGFTESPTDAQLTAAARWSRQFDAKAIPMAKIVTNG